MAIEEDKFGYRNLEEENYEYRACQVIGLSLLHSDRDQNVKFAVNSALRKLKRLDRRWEFSHIDPGTPFQQRPEEKAFWPILFFKKPK
jgi:hypothetical protein